MMRKLKSSNAAKGQRKKNDKARRKIAEKFLPKLRGDYPVIKFTQWVGELMNSKRPLGASIE
jgi:hypothetical protein